MVQTQAWRAESMCPAIAPVSTVRERRSRRLGRQLWTLLHAQALLNGTPGGRGDVAVVEDDYQRLAARRTW
jgi:hypothetical protein